MRRIRETGSGLSVPTVRKSSIRNRLKHDAELLLWETLLQEPELIYTRELRRIPLPNS